MQKKTLGGERLGTGKQMQVEMHGYERSTHDLSYIWRSTMSAGTLVPFICEVMLPGDTFDIDLDCDVKTHPTIGPLFGSYKVQLDVFQVPMRLYNALTHNNMLGIGLDMSKVKLPLINLTAKPIPTDVQDINNAQINPSSILAYLGIRGIGRPGETEIVRSFNAIPLLAYWEIYKNYYSNKQEKVGAVIHAVNPTATAQTVETVTVRRTLNQNFAWNIQQSPNVSEAYTLDQTCTITIYWTGTQPDPKQIYFYLEGFQPISFYDLVGGNIQILSDQMTGTFDFEKYDYATIRNWDYMTNTQPIAVTPQVHLFGLDAIDEMRLNILSTPSESVPFIVNTADLEPYKFVYESTEGVPNILNSQEGLALKTYQSDLFNNWLETAYITAINSTTAISTAGGSFTIDQLNLSKKIYDLLNRVAVSGGTYHDWVEAVYSIEKSRIVESPMYMGGLIKELVFQEVVSNSLSENQPLGTLAGKGRMADKHKGGNIYIKTDEPSYVMGIISLTPRVDYSQGNKWDVHLRTFDDLHKPALDQIGFQDLIMEQMAWWDTEYNGSTWVQRSAGKQPAWVNYMTNVNKTYGNFAIENNEMFMTLNRRYEYETDEGIADMTTYIDPSKFNFIFAQTALDAQNFWTQISVNITARRKMSAKIMPNL